MKKYTKEQLLFYLKKTASEFKKSPTIEDLNRARELPSSTTYIKRFGSWNAALKAAGLKINAKQKYEAQEMIESLRQLAKELGRLPKNSDLKGKKWIASSATYRKYFGSWKKALQAAELKEGSFINLKTFSKKSLN